MSVDAALVDAAKAGDIGGVGAALDAGAHTDFKCAYGQTALSWAANNGHAAVLQLLLERHAATNAKSRSGGNTPLHLAAHRGHAECARLLLDGGADKDAKNDDGRTPLHYAAMYSKLDVVRLLVEHGADVTAKNEAGETPLDKARDDATRALLSGAGAGAAVST